MIKGKTVLAVILARGGSKGIPGKNTRLLAGKPLIAWSIEAANNSKYIDRVVVSTDSDEIATVAKIWKADVPFIRPSNLARDESSSEDAILHTLKWLKSNEDKQYDYFILLQPTSPLRNQKHIDEAFEKFENTVSADSLISVKNIDKNPSLIRKIKQDGFLEKYLDLSSKNKRRQDSADLCVPNGAIYISKTSTFIKTKSLEVNCSYYFMEKAISVDIDEEYDFELAEYYLTKSKS